MDPYFRGFLGRLKKAAQAGTTWFSDYPSREEYLRTTLDPDKYENYLQDREAAMRLTEDAVDPSQWPEGLFDRFRDLWESRNGMAPRAGNPVYDRHPEQWFQDSEAYRARAAERDRRALRDAENRVSEASRLHSAYKDETEAAARSREIADAAFNSAIGNGKALGGAYGTFGGVSRSFNDRVLKSIRDLQMGIPDLVDSKSGNTGWMANIGSLGDVVREARNSVDEASGGDFSDPVSAEKLISFGRRIGGDQDMLRTVFDATNGNMNLVTALSALGSLDETAASGLSRAYSDKYRSSRIPVSLRPPDPEFAPGSLVPKTEYADTENGFVPVKTTYAPYEYPSKEWRDKVSPYLKNSQGRWIPEAEALINGVNKWHDRPSVPAKATSPKPSATPSAMPSGHPAAPAVAGSPSADLDATMGKSAGSKWKKRISEARSVAKEVRHTVKDIKNEDADDQPDEAAGGSGTESASPSVPHGGPSGPEGSESGATADTAPKPSDAPKDEKPSTGSKGSSDSVANAISALTNALAGNESEKKKDKIKAVVGAGARIVNDHLSDEDKEKLKSKTEKVKDRAAGYIADKIPGQTAESVKAVAGTAARNAVDRLNNDPSASAKDVARSFKHDVSSQTKKQYLDPLQRKKGQGVFEYLKQVSDYYVPIAEDTASKSKDRRVPVRGRIDHPRLPGVSFPFKTSVRLPPETLQAIGGSIDNLEAVNRKDGSGVPSGGVRRAPGEMGDLGERLMRGRLGKGESASAGAALGLLSQSPGLAGAGVGALLGLGAGAIGKKDKRSKRMLILSLLGGALGGVGASAGAGAYAGVKSRPYAEKAINNAGALVAGMSPLAGTETAASLSSRVGADKVKALKNIAVAVSGNGRKGSSTLDTRMAGKYRNGKGGKS